MTTTIPVFTTNDEYDRDRASYGDSRYGIYLKDRTHEFFDEGQHLTEDPRDFLRVAFEIATGPIMSPGYITIHPRVTRTAWHHDEDGRMSIRVCLADGHRPPAFARLGMMASWDQRSVLGIEYWDEPWDDDRPRLYTTHTVLVPIPVGDLPDAKYCVSSRTRVFPDVATAKDTLARLCRTVNAVAGPVLAALESGRV